MFDAFYDVEEKMKKGNPYAKKARCQDLTALRLCPSNHE